MQIPSNRPNSHQGKLVRSTGHGAHGIVRVIRTDTRQTSLTSKHSVGYIRAQQAIATQIQRHIVDQIARGFSKLSPEEQAKNVSQLNAEAQWEARFAAPGHPYDMNDLSDNQQISTGIGSNSTSITVYDGDNSVTFIQDTSEARKSHDPKHIAGRIQPSNNRIEDYHFTEAREIRSDLSPAPTNIDPVLKIIRSHIQDPSSGVAFYTGAGISRASGIDDINGYRRRISGISEGNLAEAAIARLTNNPAAVLDSIKEFYRSLYMSEPSPCHRAIADIVVKAAKPIPVFTENLDLMHQKTGINVIAMKPASQMRPALDITKLKKINLLVCTGLSRDDRGFIAYLRENNPKLIIIGSALPEQRPLFIDPANTDDIYLPGDAQEIFPELAKY